MRAGEGCYHKGEKRRSRLNRQAVFLIFTKIVNYERSSLGYLTLRARGKLYCLVKFIVCTVEICVPTGSALN